MNVEDTTREARIRGLAWSFPALKKAPGVDPWDAMLLDRWAESGSASSGERQAARFILCVWNRHEWGNKFFMSDALNTWDDKNLKAFQGWVAAPWFC